MALYFKLHVIPSRKPLNWKTPRSLLTCTLFNHLIQDMAPIGHFFIEFESDTANQYGVQKIITGMSRAHKNQSSLTVIKEKVGLGTFFYDFEGKLDDSVKALAELKWAREQKRLKTISVEISPETSRILMDELHQWIAHGSFRHYSGGLQILKGEGSGCAEFGAHFLNLALGMRATPREWIRSVYAPKKLVGGKKTDKKVGFTKVFALGTSWAKNEEDGILYETPDMDLTWNWMESRAPGSTEVILKASEITWGEKKAELKIQFLAQYGSEAESEIREQWERVKA